MLPAGNAVDSGPGDFRLGRPLELVPFYCHCNLKLPSLRGCRRRTAQDLAQAVEVDRGVVSRKRDDVFDPRANVDAGRRHKTHAAGADVPGLLGAIYSLVAQLQNTEGELQSVSLGPSLFQEDTVMYQLLRKQWVRVLSDRVHRSVLYGKCHNRFRD